jgi:hypothetical protein
LLAHGRWFSPDTSSTTKTGRYDISEILLKVALNTKIKNQIVVSQGKDKGRSDEKTLTKYYRINL